MKAFRYIFLSTCALAEAALFAFGITGFIAYRGDPDPNVPTMVVAAVTVCALALLGITIKSFINVSKDREAPVIYGFLLKFPVMIFALGIMWFALGIPEAGWLAVILARFGGRPDSADNQVVVPRAAAERKRQFEDLIEALFVLKLAEHYDCKITYQEGKPNYLFLEATAGSRRTFADSIGLGF